MRPLDEVSDHMGQILRHADELLAEWAAFGAQVKSQVERETQVIGNAVATAVDEAVSRSVATTAAHVDRAVTQAMAERVGSQLQALTAELGRLEARAKAASRLVADQRTGDRKILWGIAGGIAIANVLLALVLLKKPAAPDVVPQAVPVVEPHHDEAAAPPPTPAPNDPSAAAAVGSGDGSATTDKLADPAPAKDVPSVDAAIRSAHGVPSRKR
ncbi:MAG TPA: hypothetical protein VGO00_20330 [Kofleriaceae bacterium]|jgi:hypothetical protein|nr:hypothetical protein [Kofleriaceae bacterium]